MVKIDLKKIFDLRKILLLVIFFLSLFGFLNFEVIVALKIIMIFFVCLATFLMVRQNDDSFFILITLYLIFFDLYNIYFSLIWPLWLVTLIAAIAVAIIFFFFSMANSFIMKNNLWYVYLIMLIIISIEVFLSQLPWQINPKGKSIILTALFYLFGGMSYLKNSNEYNFKKSLPYLLTSIIIFIIVIITSNWYGY